MSPCLYFKKSAEQLVYWFKKNKDLYFTYFKECLYSFFSHLAYEILCIHTWSNRETTATYGRNPENITVNECPSQDPTVSYHLILQVSPWDPGKTNQCKSRNSKLFLTNVFQMATFPCTLLKQVTSAFFYGITQEFSKIKCII